MVSSFSNVLQCDFEVTGNLLWWRNVMVAGRVTDVRLLSFLNYHEVIFRHFPSAEPGTVTLVHHVDGVAVYQHHDKNAIYIR
jgi:hypothetical protein